MPKQLTVSFEGLCGFVSRNSTIEAYLLSGHGKHGQQLLIRTDFINVPETTWKPTSVALIRDFDEATRKPALKQVAIWSLKTLEATFSDGTGEPKWQNKARVIDFKTEHVESATSSKADIKKKDAAVAIVTLVGDKTVLDPEPPSQKDNFVLRKNGVEHKKYQFSRIAQWSTSSNAIPSIQNSAMKKIVLRKDLENWWATVSNVAPVPADEGLAHFEHYYDAVTIKAGDFPMTIEQAFADVYDCVPPVAFP